MLNGCMEFKNLYVARHNRIVKLIGEQIAADKLDFKIHCDKIVKPEMFVNESEISDQSFISMGQPPKAQSVVSK